MPPSGPPAVSPDPALPFPARWSCCPLEDAALASALLPWAPQARPRLALPGRTFDSALI